MTATRRFPLQYSFYFFALWSIVGFASLYLLDARLPLGTARLWLMPIFSSSSAALVGAVGCLFASRFAAPSVVQVPPRKRRFVPFVGTLAVHYSLFAMALGLGALNVSAPTPSAAKVTLWFVALSSLVQAIMILVRERRFRSFASRILRASKEQRREGPLSDTHNAPRLFERYIRNASSLSRAADGKLQESDEAAFSVSDELILGEFSVASKEGSARVDPHNASVSFAKREFVADANAESTIESRTENGWPVTLVENAIFFGSKAQLSKEWLFSWAKILVLLALTLGAIATCDFSPYAVRYETRVQNIVVQAGAVDAGFKPNACAMQIRAYAARDEYVRCTVRLDCDGQRDVGGFEMGQMACLGTSGDVFGQDGDPHDGDAALSFDTRTRAVSFQSDAISWRGQMVGLRVLPKNPSR